MRCALRTIPILLAAAAHAQSGAIWSELSTDGIHWHTDWWPTTHLPEYFRVRASWTNIPNAAGCAAAEFNACVAQATVSQLTDLGIPEKLNGLGQVIAPQDSGGRICVVSTNGGTSYIVATQTPPAQNLNFEADNPVTLLTGTLLPPQSGMGSVSLFPNPSAGHGLRVYTSPQGAIFQIPPAALTRRNASFFSTSAGCAYMDQPVDQRAAPGAKIIFTATYGQPASYQWYKDGARLTESDHYSGVNSICLTIDAAQLQDRGSYSCQVTSAQCPHALPSRSAVLEVVCPADFNNDDQLDLSDVLDFLQVFADDAPAADFNGDHTIDLFDCLDFLKAFSIGC